ncbi:MAG TPA: DUF58 domain-containing protein [Gemmatimonadaceae bacterium]
MTLAEVLAQVRRLELRSRRLARELLAGEYASAFKGRGVEFADVRPYVIGDDVRTIDWRVTARTGEAYVRRYVEERELTIMLAVDRSASDAFGSARRTKADLATELCATLALTAARTSDRVGAVLFTDRVERYLPPEKGMRHALRVVREMVAFEPSGTGTDVAAALEFVSRVARRRVVLFVMSDWIATGWEHALTLIAQRHDTIAVQLADPRERELPDVGLVALADPESERWRWVDTGDARVREHLRAAAHERDAALARALRRHGADVVRLRTDRGYVAPLLALFRARERMPRH